MKLTEEDLANAVNSYFPKSFPSYLPDEKIQELRDTLISRYNFLHTYLDKDFLESICAKGEYGTDKIYEKLRACTHELLTADMLLRHNLQLYTSDERAKLFGKKAVIQTL